jgi:hypothetical protein
MHAAAHVLVAPSADGQLAYVEPAEIHPLEEAKMTVFVGGPVLELSALRLLHVCDHDRHFLLHFQLSWTL